MVEVALVEGPAFGGGGAGLVGLGIGDLGLAEAACAALDVWTPGADFRCLCDCGLTGVG